MKMNIEDHFIPQKSQKGTAKIQTLEFAEDLSIPSYQVIVMTANLGCDSCRDKVTKVLSKMKGFKEYTVDVRKKQVIIKGDLNILRSTKKRLLNQDN